MSEEQIDAVVEELMAQWRGYFSMVRSMAPEEWHRALMRSFSSGVLVAVKALLPGTDLRNHSEAYKQIFLRFAKRRYQLERELATPETIKG